MPTLPQLERFVLSPEQKQKRHEETFGTSSREKLVDSIYEHFTKAHAKKTIIRYSDFKKFEILYNQELKQRVMKGEATEEEIDTVTKLSSELMNTIDPYKPFKVIDDQTEEVIFTLPALFMPINYLHGKAGFTVDKLAQAIIHDDGQRGSISDINVTKSLSDLYRTVTAAQSKEDILKHIDVTNQLAQKFHKTVHGKGVFEEVPSANSSITEATKPATNQSNIDDVAHPEDGFF